MRAVSRDIERVSTGLAVAASQQPGPWSEGADVTPQPLSRPQSRPCRVQPFPVRLSSALQDDASRKKPGQQPQKASAPLVRGPGPCPPRWAFPPDPPPFAMPPRWSIMLLEVKADSCRRPSTAPNGPRSPRTCWARCRLAVGVLPDRTYGGGRAAVLVPVHIKLEVVTLSKKCRGANGEGGWGASLRRLQG